MSEHQFLDAPALLEAIATRIPARARPKVVIIGSIATAWAFRDLAGTGQVATKDIDVLLQPAVDAVATATAIGENLLGHHWTPWFRDDRGPGSADTPDDQLPALRLVPPGVEAGWFVELLAMPTANQTERRLWTRFQTAAGHFGLPSFRYMPVAVQDASESPYGLRVAKPPNMALAHLLEHADPDTTPIETLEGRPSRYIKDVGRAVSLWWLAQQQSSRAQDEWRAAWQATLTKLYPSSAAAQVAMARAGLASLSGRLPDAHRIAMLGVLAPHGTTLDAFRRSCEGLSQLVGDW